MAVKWRLLTSSANMMEAEILRGALESANIPVNLKWESFNTVLFGAAATGPGSQVQVYVPEELWDEARVYLSCPD